MTTSSTLCLICNGTCISNRNFVQIFNKEPRVVRELSLPIVLSKLLDKNVTEESVHSKLLCRRCYKIVDEYDELQSRIQEIKNDLFTSYSNTLEKRSNPGYSENADTEDETTKVGQEVPKKILDIPSSDEEFAQAEKSSVQTMKDIEMTLVKIQNGRSSIDQTDMEVDNNSQSFTNFGGHSDDEYEVAVPSGDDILVRSSDAAEKNSIMNLNIKTEPSSDESIAPSASVSDHKPNILKKRKTTITHDATIQETVIAGHGSDEPRRDESNMPIVTRDQDIYTCLMCVGDETVAGPAKAIIGHMKQAHETRLYICDVCGQDFRKRNLLSAHLDDHVAAEEGDFQCEVCNRIFNNLRLFRIHRRMHYPQNKAWSCDTCGKRYSSKNLLDEHVNTHLGVRPYICSTCGKDFASKYTFKAHEKTHEIRPRPYKCEKCQKSFLSAQNLAQHEKTHLGMKEYACHLCGKQFSSAHNLEVHSIVHSGYKPFVCGLCGKAFARKAEIRDHERTHTGERPYQCEFCGATFSQRSNLQSHKRATHYDDKRYQCVECGKGFKRRRLLDYHVKAAHTGERPYKCETCEATFVYPEHFKKHRRIHTGEKPYLCEVCGKAFNSRDNRNAHRFVHSDKKPYECLVCGAGFMRKPLLYQHMQTQGHLNDTIVVNQPRLTTDDEQIVTVNAAGEMEFVDPSTVGESKLYITGEDGSEHIIIDGQQISFADAGSDDEQQPENVDEIEQIVAGGVDEFEEIISTDALSSGETQIIETPNGPIQLVKVKIPNENGEEEEAWIKIVPE